MKKLIPIIILILIVPVLSFSATYYVEDKGSSNLNLTDEGVTAWGNATNVSTPTSAETAMVNAIAGDVVEFRGGHYELGVTPYGAGDSIYRSILYPRNSGTSSNKITFKAYTGETPVLDGDPAPLTSDFWVNGEALFSNNLGVFNTDYIVIDGFTYKCDNGTSLATCVITGRDVTTSTGCEVKNCTFDGGTTRNGNGYYNLQGIRLESATNTLVENNVIDGYNGIPDEDAHNTSGVKYYTAVGTTFRNNNISGCDTAFYDKSRGINNTVANNWITGAYVGIFVDGKFDTATGGVIRNNLIQYTHKGIDVYQPLNLTSCEIYNNTLYSTNETVASDDHGIRVWMGTGYKIYNNIIYCVPSTEYGHIGSWGDQAYYDEFDHNLYYNPLASGLYIRLRPGDNPDPTYTIYTTLPAFQAADILVATYDAGCGSSLKPGCGSVNAQPVFVGGATPSTIAGFALDTGSPGENADRSGDDMGADVSLVGVDASSTNPVINAGTDQAVSIDSASISGTYTLEGGRTVSSCTWSNDRGGSGTLTATGGAITGTVTGLSSGVNVITITVTDSEAEEGSDSLNVTYTPVVSTISTNSSISAGCMIR